MVYYNCPADGIGDALGRLDNIASTDDNPQAADKFAACTYLGAGTIVQVAHPAVGAGTPPAGLTLDYGSGGTYGGLDRFGRVVDQKWTEPLPLDGGGGGGAAGGGATLDRFRYGYDAASNRLWRENPVSKALGTAVHLDEFYACDGLDRLANARRGTLAGTPYSGIDGTPADEQDWSLDALGNWSGYLTKSDTGGGLATDLDQTRAHNAVNEITGISETTGPAWADPVYDARGNMTTIPKPADPTGTLTATYDAWHRLVEVKDGATVIHRAECDGLNRRVKKGLDSDAPADPDGLDTYVHYYYNSAWQVLEERWTATVDEAAEEIQPRYQFVWSLRYIDAPVCRDANTDDDNQCDDERLFYATDANMNVTALIDGTAGSGTLGEVVERYLYDPYGTVTILDGSWGARSESAYGNDVLYCGYKYDAATGIYLVRHRPYVPRFGWSVRDFIPYPDGMNLYTYATSDPTNALDTHGFATIHLAFNAFISGDRGDWLDVPGDIGTQFATDQRTFGEFSPLAENARLFSFAIFSSRKIGSLENSPWIYAYNAVGESKQRHMDEIDGWRIRSKRAPLLDNRFHVKDYACVSVISFRAVATYPFKGPAQFFLPFVQAPPIIYRAVFWVEVLQENTVSITLHTMHTAFPDFEAYAGTTFTDWNLIYQRKSPDHGPGFHNLGERGYNVSDTVTTEIHGVRTPPCCPRPRGEQHVMAI